MKLFHIYPKCTLRKIQWWVSKNGRYHSFHHRPRVLKFSFPFLVVGPVFVQLFQVLRDRWSWLSRKYDNRPPHVEDFSQQHVSLSSWTSQQSTNVLQSLATFTFFKKKFTIFHWYQAILVDLGDAGHAAPALWVQWSSCCFFLGGGVVQNTCGQGTMEI